MKWNPWILPVALGLSLGMVYVLPKAGKTAESAVKTELPGYMGGWSFDPMPASEDEVKTLSPDTKFFKAICSRVRPSELSLTGDLMYDRIDLSVVLSGHDLNNSIHRPERCMPAQGHKNLVGDDVTLRMDDGREFKAKRIHSDQNTTDPAGKVVRTDKCLTYYFFVGHDRITNDHLSRTLIDMKDRLVFGRDQRWAYVSISMWYGKLDLPWLHAEVTEAEADKKVRQFLAEFGERQIDWNQIHP